MSRLVYIVALSLFLSPAVRAQEKKAEPKPLHETWQAAYVEGLKIGHGHVLAVNVKRGDATLIRTTRTLDIVLKRYNSVLPIKMEQVCEETSDGKVKYLEETLTIGKDKRGPVKGVVNGNELAVTLGDNNFKLKMPADVIGAHAQENIFATKKVKAGDTLKITTFELSLLGPLTVSASVKEIERADRLVLQTVDGKEKVVRQPARLLRVDVAPGKVTINGMEIQLPGKKAWLDAKLMTVREQFEMPGVGMVTMYTTTKEAALKDGVAPALLPDLGLNVSIPVKKTIEKPYDTSEVVYRVTMTEPLEKVFAGDERQKTREAKEKSFELVVKSVREPGKTETEKPGEEFLESNHFLESDNATIKSLAGKAVGKEKDAWEKAKKIEKWVHENMKVSTATGFPTAAKIAKDLEGDCRQHALLTAAMCRAAGVPSRTAIGLIYVRDEGRSPIFGFHMWTEVWVRGKWLGLDAILGKGGIGATHLKMADHSWAKTVTLAPLLPVARTLGKLQIEVVSAK